MSMQFYAIKGHQHHAYDQNGKRLFITRLAAQTLVVTQVKTTEKDGYKALQVGFGARKKVTKPLAGHLKAAAATPHHLKEIRLGLEKAVAQTIAATEVFQVGDRVSLHATSKGIGFAGGVKRHHFKGGPKTHGQSDRTRAPGSIGQGTTPGRVHRGKRMAGHMGNEAVAVRGGVIAAIDETAQEVWVTGSVPGKRGAVVGIKKVKTGKFVGLRQGVGSSVEDTVAPESEVKTEE